MSEESCSFEYLEGHRYARLTTYRKSGEPVPIPVWFAVVRYADDRLYIFTDARSGKAKRIRNDPRVENVLLPVRDGIMLVRKL